MHPVEIFELIIGMFLAVLVLQYAALRLRLPPAVALLMGVGALAFIPGLPTVELDPELMLVIFLPPLLMDGAWFTALASFRRHRRHHLPRGRRGAVHGGRRRDRR
ncbi:MAG TPA: cation:proton antiporter [Roseomonas sp.]|jgi:CPA1 family monovalent cation:H+ antiporter